MASPVTPLHPPGDTPSIQGEQQAAHGVLFADLGYVDALAGRVSDGIATCRARYRHNYPPLPRTQMRFDSVSAGGYLIRRTPPCADCGCAIQVQYWEAYTVGKGRQQDVRVRPHHLAVEYQENDFGETYPTQGHGMVRPRDFRDAIASSALDDAEAQEWVAAALRQQRAVERKRQERAKAGR